MPSPFDMITHSPIMQLANLARAGQNPMGLIQQLGGQSAPIMQGLNLIQGKNEAQLRTMAQNLAKERGIDLNQLASVLNAVSLKAYGSQSLPYVSNTILGYLQFPHTHEFPSSYQFLFFCNFNSWKLSDFAPCSHIIAMSSFYDIHSICLFDIFALNHSNNLS